MEYAGLKLTESNGKWFFIDEELASTHHGKHARYDLLDVLMKKYSLKESKSHTYPDWGKLISLQYRSKYRQLRTNRYQAKDDLKIMLDIDDHTKLFYFSKDNYVYTTQHYYLTLEKFQEFESIWVKMGVHVNISYKDAWWFPGKTPLITLSNCYIDLEK